MNLLKKNKIIVLFLGLLVFGSFTVYNYIYKSHKTINELPIKFSGTSKTLLNKVKNDVTQWQGIIVEVSGNISSIDEKGITIDSSIYCQFKNPVSIDTLKKTNHITVKGRMIGYDDLLEEIKLDQTIIK